MQLRNLLWATSKHDLYFMHDHCVKHWNSLTRQTTEVIRVDFSQLLSCKFCICDIPHFAIACKQIYLLHIASLYHLACMLAPEQTILVWASEETAPIVAL